MGGTAYAGKGGLLRLCDSTVAFRFPAAGFHGVGFAGPCNFAYRLRPSSKRARRCPTLAAITTTAIYPSFLILILAILFNSN